MLSKKWSRGLCQDIWISMWISFFGKGSFQRPEYSLLPDWQQSIFRPLVPLGPLYTHSRWFIPLQFGVLKELFPKAKKKCVITVTCWKKLGSVRRKCIFFNFSFYKAKKKICVFTVTFWKKIRVGRSEILFFLILFFITKLMLDDI